MVEDSGDTRDLLREALQDCGAFVTTAASKKEAERLLQDLQPHVIVSDIAMPDDGVALVRHVMDLVTARGADIPVIAMTRNRHVSRAQVPVVRAVEFVPKPLDPIALCRRIRAHVPPER